MEQMYMTAKETAEYLGVSKSTFQRHFAYRLPRYKLGKRYKYKKDEIDKELRNKNRRIGSSY